MLKAILTDGMWAFGVKLIGVCGSLFVQALLARMLIKDELGQYFIFFSLATCGAMLARFGMRQTVVKFVAESHALKLGQRLRKALRIMLITVLAGVGIVTAAFYGGAGKLLIESVFDLHVDHQIIWLISLWIALLAFLTPVAEAFRGIDDVRLATFIDGPAGNLMIGLVLIFLFLGNFRGLALHHVIFITCTAQLINLLFFSVCLHRKTYQIEGRGDVTPSEILHVSGPIFVSNISLYIVGQANLWIAGAFLASNDVANFGVALKLILVVTMPLLIINLAVQPAIAKLYAKQQLYDLEKVLRGTASVATLFAGMVVILLVAFPETILDLVFGAGFRDAKYVLMIMAVGKLVHVWAGSCGNVLVLTGNQRTMMNIALITGASAILAYLLFVGRWGIEGIAFVGALSWIAQNLLCVLAVRRRLGIWTQADFRFKSVHSNLDLIFAKPSERS